MQSTSPPHAPAVRSFSSKSININEDASVNYWLQALQCKEYELRVAVAAVGTSAQDVGIALGRAL